MKSFQSTLPAWGATTASTACITARLGFNPRSPRGERRADGWKAARHLFVSIHAPRVGSDELRAVCGGGWKSFNPRSPRGERRRMTYVVLCATHSLP
jgi:hypothetical protein